MFKSKPNPNVPTKYRRTREGEPIYVVLDAGNADIKAMLHPNFGEEIVFPHAVDRRTEADYADIVEKYKYRSAQYQGTAIFQVDGVGYVIGEHAAQVGKGKSLSGAAKYKRDHMGALFCAAMVQLYPKSHNDVHVVVLHPADINAANMKAMAQSLKGVHNVKVADGRKLQYNVTEIMPIEEPVSGFQTFLLTTEGRTYSRERFTLKPGMRVLVLDIGGWLTSFLPAIVTRSGGVELNITNIPVFRSGILDIREEFQRQLKDKFPELTEVQEVPSWILYDALMNDEIMLSGKPFDCEKQVDNAMGVLAQQVQGRYTGMFQNGLGYAAIIVSGGGGGIAFNYFSEKVLNHPNIFTAEDDLDRMRFSNVRGASKGLIPYLAMKQQMKD